jgi:hypothetical protein
MRGVTRALLGAAMVLAIGVSGRATAMAAAKFTRVGAIPGTGGRGVLVRTHRRRNTSHRPPEFG